MIDILNIITMILTIGLGMIGWLAPRYTMGILHLETGQSPRGMSEIRAASGALFVGAAAGALYFGTPVAFAMIGFLYSGAAIGRITSILLDGSGDKTMWTFFAVEAVLAGFLLWANLPAAL